MCLGAVSSEIKLPEREAESPSLYSAKFEKVCNYTYTIPYIFKAWCQAERKIEGSYLSLSTVPPLYPAQKSRQVFSGLGMDGMVVIMIKTEDWVESKEEHRKI
jgi:hypothetical protein